jgi:hypothetical protein
MQVNSHVTSLFIFQSYCIPLLSQLINCLVNELFAELTPNIMQAVSIKRCYKTAYGPCQLLCVGGGRLMGNVLDWNRNRDMWIQP